ncbi:MAG: hypothetical protein MK130_09555 [Puniceicoccaceae bacterium]|nr:hypothetical protein [Puniceicoccaceae bacterium]
MGRAKKQRRAVHSSRYLVGSKLYQEFCNRGNITRPETLSVSVTTEMKEFLEQEADRKGVSINFELFDRLLQLHGMRDLNSLEILEPKARMRAYGDAAEAALEGML